MTTIRRPRCLTKEPWIWPPKQQTLLLSTRNWLLVNVRCSDSAESTVLSMHPIDCSFLIVRIRIVCIISLAGPPPAAPATVILEEAASPFSHLWPSRLYQSAESHSLGRHGEELSSLVDHHQGQDYCKLPQLGHRYEKELRNSSGVALVNRLQADIQQCLCQKNTQFSIIWKAASNIWNHILVQPLIRNHQHRVSQPLLHHGTIVWHQYTDWWLLSPFHPSTYH